MLGFLEYFKMKNQNTMKKSDLKTGMVVENKKGELSLVMRDTEVGDIFAGSGCDNEFWCPFRSFDESLNNKDTGRYDIVKVYSVNNVCNISAAKVSSNNRELIWEREETVEIDGKEYSESTVKKALQEYVK